MRLDIDTPHGTAWADLDLPAGRPGTARGLLALGHGASGGVQAPDLAAVQAAALAAGYAVALITQPYRVAGRRSPAPAAQLDAAWLAVLAALGRRGGLGGLAVAVGGRSSGARVACRTADAAAAGAVVALSFPVHRPGRPDRSRLPELALPRAPVLVVQGDRDSFGMPPADAVRRLVVIPGADHGLRKSTAVTAAAVVDFLDDNLARLSPPR